MNSRETKSFPSSFGEYIVTKKDNGTVNLTINEFNITLTELENLVSYAVHGLAVKEIARYRGKSIYTVKRQIKSLIKRNSFSEDNNISLTEVSVKAFNAGLLNEMTLIALRNLRKDNN